MQKNDHPAEGIYGRRDTSERREVRLLWKAYTRHLDVISTPTNVHSKIALKGDDYE